MNKNHRFTETLIAVCNKKNWTLNQVCADERKWDYIVTTIAIKFHLSQEVLNLGLNDEYNNWSNQILFGNF